jgi:2-methylcitrate dehydratase PrpD
MTKDAAAERERTIDVPNEHDALTASQLASFVCSLAAGDVPDRVTERAELSILDTIASMIGGVPTANARQMRQAASAFFGQGDSAVWFAGQRMHRGGALLANCAAASALDIDDGHRGASGHPGAAIVPAVLQEAAARGADGRDILAAVAIGYDVALRIASARRAGTVKTYSSGRWTGYGVAAAVGWLRKLPAHQMIHAITIAGAESPENLPAGSYRRLSSVKGSSPWSTLTAMVAVDRASAGADGPEDSLDRTDVFDPPEIVRDLGSRWLIEDTYMKPYASCRYTHPSIDGMLRIAAGRDISAQNIAALKVEVFPEAFTITNVRVPKTLESAQFSIPFCLALATLRGGSAFRPMTEQMLDDSEVVALSCRVEMVEGADFVGSFPAKTASRVHLTLGNETYEETVDFPLGDPANPLARKDIEQKLDDLGRSVLSAGRGRAIVGGCDALRSGRKDLLGALS